MNAITPIKPAYNMDTLVEKFVALRDKLGELKKTHQEIEAKFNQGLEYLEGHILDLLNAAGANHIATPHGTAIKAVQTSAMVQDWPATLAFIQEHNAWDLLEARVSKSAAVGIVEETKAPIPGVQISQRVTVNVRRPTKRT